MNHCSLINQIAILVGWHLSWKPFFFFDNGREMITDF